jgi:fructokinase
MKFAGGAFAMTVDGVHDGPGERVTVLDTAGAGDAVTAGLLATCATVPLPGTLRLAGRVATLTCTRPGADPPAVAEVEAASPGATAETCTGPAARPG